MKACMTYKHNVETDEPIDNLQAWFPAVYNGLSGGNDAFYQSNSFSSPIAYSRPSYNFPNEVYGAMFNNPRLSSMPSKCSNWSRELVTPPVTPEQYRGWQSSIATMMTQTPSTEAYLHSDDFADGQLNEDLYLPDTLQLSLDHHTMSRRQSYHTRSDVSDTHGFVTPFHADASDPALGQQIFLEAPQTPAWQASRTYRGLCSTPKTIAPKATIQTSFHSSPLGKVDGSSPYATSTGTDFEYGLDSSPLPVPLQAVLPSQHSFSVLDPQCSPQSNDQQPSFTRSPPRRPSRRLNQRKALRSMATKPRSDSDTSICNGGVKDVVPANTFVCTVPGCLDKARGKPKTFKRQEHRKRHEKTTHGDIHGDIAKTACWVPQCHRLFPRPDNLRQHYTTHGKNSPTSRNRYVATLDKSSQFYDPDWRGDLTDDGFPIIAEVKIQPCWVEGCDKMYHLESKMKTHLLQQHGRKSSNPSAIYVATLDENSELFDLNWKGQVTEDGTPIR